MRQYIAITDHILWDIITNGDQATTDPVSSSGPVHLLSFHDAEDAKTLWSAIKARFGGNEASKKMQKNLLKQQFETFTIGSREELDSAYESWLQCFGDNLDWLNWMFDALYNNLKSCSTLKQSTADPENIPKGYTQAASSKVQTAPNCASHSDEIICSFFAQQASMPTTHDDEDLLQIDEDAMKKLTSDGRFAKYQENRANGRKEKKIVAIEDSNSKALVATDNNEEIDWTKEFDAEPIDAEPVHFGQDGLSDFDWSNKADDTPVSLALMATNSEVPYCSKCSKSYKQLLENYQTEKDNFQKAREKQKELDQVLKERDDFKVKLEKWTNAAVLQNEVLNKQRYLSDKSCIGFGVESSSSKESDNSSGNTNSTESLYPNFQKAKGFHAVPPPTGTIIPPRENVSFTGIDELAIRNKVINQENTKSRQSEIDRNKVIIEDWVDSDDEETALNFSEIQKKTDLNSENSKTSFENRSPNNQNSVGQGSRKKGLGHKGVKTCFVCYSPDHLIKDCNLHERTFKQTKPINLRERRVQGTQDQSGTTSIGLTIVTSQETLGTARPRVPQAVLSQSTGRPYYPRMDNIRPRTSSFSPSTSTVGSQAVLPQNVSVKGSAMINPTQTWRPKGAYLDSVNRDNGSYTLKQFEAIQKKISKTKHIQIRHHFIRDCYEQRLINVVKVHTDDNVEDLLTKGFDLARFNFLVVTIEETIRADLLFDDADGVDCFPKQEKNSPKFSGRINTFDSTNVRGGITALAQGKHIVRVLILGLKSSQGSQGTPTQSAAQASISQGTVTFKIKTKKRDSIKQKRRCLLLLLLLSIRKEDVDATEAVVTPDLERKSDETEEVLIEEEKYASDVKSGDTEELDLERIQSTARQSTVTPRTLDFDDEAGQSSPIRPTQQEEFKDDEFLTDLNRTRGLSIPGPMQSQPQQPTQATDPKEKGKGILVEEPKKKKLTLQQIRALETKNDEEVARKIQAEWDAEEERKRLEALKKPKTILKKPTSLVQERNQMMSFLKGQGYKNLQKLKYPQMKELYDKVQESIKDSFKDFIPIGSEKEKQMLQERDAKRLLRKRKVTVTEEQPSKKLKLRTETIDELRNYLRIVDFEKSAQDRESLEAISNIQLQVNNSLHGVDLHHLYLVVQDYYKHIPPTGLGLILLGDLTTIWETSATSNDDFWKNQEDWKIVRWRL
ncbi:hypothetical protein Tco_0716867 [Tanacetum coccineum]